MPKKDNLVSTLALGCRDGFWEEHKKKFLLAAAAAAVVVLVAIIVTIVVVVTNSSVPTKQLKNPITLEEYLNGTFKSKTFNGSWWSNSELQWKDADGNIVLWNLETNSTSILVSKDLLSRYGSSSKFMGFAPNSKSLLLFASGIESVFRHSSTAYYFVLDTVRNVSHPLVPYQDLQKEDSKLQFAEWLPHHPTADRLVLVHGNDLYVSSVASDFTTTFRVTSDGVPGEIYNGVPDWVFEEEVLHANKAVYYSRRGSKMAFARFDDTEVREFHYTKYGDPDSKSPREVQYPEEVAVRYPKAGSRNPTVTLKVTDLERREWTTKVVVPPDDVVRTYGEYHYSAAEWSTVDGKDVFNVIWMNRVQSRSSVSRCKEDSFFWKCVTLHSMSQEGRGWLDLSKPPVYKSGDDSMLQILPALANDGLHYAQLAIVRNGVIEFLTTGRFVVTEILGWDERSGKVYFMGTAQGEPGRREFYSVGDSVGSTPTTCITCPLQMPGSGAACKYSSVKVSPDFRHYVHTCLGPYVPEVVVRAMDLDGSVRSVIEDNRELRAKLESKTLAVSRIMDLEGAGGVYRNFVKMLFPPNYDPASKNYSALVNIYAGPGIQKVSHKWGIGWADYLATSHDVVYVSIDGRGSGFQSEEYLFEVNRRLGSVEVEDQVAVTRQLQELHPEIDRRRTGIWGWSYGGYATLMALIKDDGGVFSCGISVAPVTDWLLYDTLYTERYMGLPTPEDNLAGYQEGSLLSKVEKLRGKVFQLNHGVADDNVHYQQSMLLVRALELADIQFDQQSFPDENHSLSRVSKFLYHSFDIFWSKCLAYDI